MGNDLATSLAILSTWRYARQVIKRIEPMLLENGFSRIPIFAPDSIFYRRDYHDLPQEISIGYSGYMHHIDVRTDANMLASGEGSKHVEYFSYHQESVVKKMDEAAAYIRTEILPAMDSYPDKLTVTLSMMKAVEKSRQRYIDLYISQFGKFPDNLFDFCGHIESLSKKKNTFSFSESREHIIMAICVYSEYICRKYDYHLKFDHNNTIDFTVLYLRRNPDSMKQDSDSLPTYVNPVHICFEVYMTGYEQALYHGEQYRGRGLRPGPKTEYFE